MAPVRFTSVLRSRDGSPYILVSAAQGSMVQPGWKTSLPVLVRIEGKPPKPWRLLMIRRIDGNFHLGLDSALLMDIRKRAGDHVNVEISFDPTPQPAVGVPIPYPNI